MPTLLYAPGVRSAIATRKAGVLDISNDLVQGTLTLTEGQPSTFSFQIANHRRKYDGIFTPNDRIVVQMRRIGPYLQVFSGYLDQVPYFSIYPRTVRLQATCTLKRLKYRLWDAGALESWGLIAETGGADATEASDQSMKQKAVDLLVKVAQWPDNQIHIGELPHQWFTRVSDIYERLGDRLAFNEKFLGDAATIAGATQTNTSGSAWVGGSGVLTPDQFLSLIKSQGGTNEEAVALGGTAATESGFDTQAHQQSGLGRGLFQIDLGQHPKITEAQAKDPIFATQWTLKAIRARVASGKDVVAACGPTLFYGPRDRPKVAAEGRAAIQQAVDRQKKPVATATGTLAGGVVGTSNTPKAPVSSPVVVQNAQVSTATGLRFVSAEGLKPNVYAAKTWIEANWPLMKGGIGRIGGLGNRPSNPGSDHPKGLALDLMVSSGPAKGEARRLGNSMARWLAENPNVFGVKYIIWYGHIINFGQGGGWRPYTDHGGHYDHPHVSFRDTGQVVAGAAGGAIAGAADGPFDGGYLDGTGVAPGEGSVGNAGGLGAGGGSPLNVYNWQGEPNIESNILGGSRALMNDDPILETVSMLMGVSMRSYMSAPNGDFIGWFPDYFGMYGTAGKMMIQDIELEDFTMVWDDSRLVTHQFVAASPYGSSDVSSLGGTVVDTMQKFMTSGIVSVEFPEVMESLLAVKPDHPVFGDAAKILQRFGARKAYEDITTIAGEQAEFWYALMLFQRSWAEQFSTNVPTTFMPELFPGMLMVIPSREFQCYVTQVTHSFNFNQGGGFTTNSVVIAPSTSKPGGGMYLPEGWR